MIKPPGYENPISKALVENLKRAQREREQRNAIYHETKSIVENAFKAPDPSSLAAKVLRAAAKARGELADETPRFSDDERGRSQKP